MIIVYQQNYSLFQSKITFTKYLANPIEKYKLHSILRLKEKSLIGEELVTTVYSVSLVLAVANFNEKELLPHSNYSHIRKKGNKKMDCFLVFQETMIYQSVY